MRRSLLLAVLLLLAPAWTAAQHVCVDCHRETTPRVVTDWELSAHHELDVGCAACHGNGHTSADDVENFQLPPTRRFRAERG